jgi:FkbM family methyltransferase
MKIINSLREHYYYFCESLKYFTVLFQMKTNYFEYLKAVIKYKQKRVVIFPAAKINLASAKFITRPNSMDIAHLSNFYERRTTKLLLKLNPLTFIDIGTHIGRFSIILAKKGSNVLSIEASKENFRQLEKNISLNKLEKKITPLNIGCSNNKGIKNLFFVPHNEGLTSLKNKKGAIKELIKTDRLDNICKKVRFPPKKINLIKIDVEGFELNVLKGAEKILKEGSPILVIEITEKEQEQEIKKFLEKFNFYCINVLDLRNFIFIKKGENIDS